MNAVKKATRLEERNTDKIIRRPSIVQSAPIHPLPSRGRVISDSLLTSHRNPGDLVGIAKLFRKDLFVALLSLVILNAAVYLYYHVVSPFYVIPEPVARGELERFFSTHTLERSVIIDSANLRGNIRATEGAVSLAMQKQIVSAFNPVARSSMATRFTKKNGGLIWERQPQ